MIPLWRWAGWNRWPRSRAVGCSSGVVPGDDNLVSGES